MKLSKKGIAGIVVMAIGLIGGLGGTITGDFPLPSGIFVALIWIIIGGALIYSDLKYIKTPAEQLWKRWGSMHQSEAQQLRIERARTNQLTVKSIDEQTKRGVFVGGQGNMYHTSLLKCSCPDFKERKVPCKHMYKLADELDLLDK